jgi:signal peptide peptidase SppA
MIDRILELAGAQPWAILEDKLHAIRGILVRHLAGEFLSHEDIVARVGREPAAPAGVTVLGNGVAVLPIHGTILPRGSILEGSGATSAATLRSSALTLAADPRVRAVVLDVNSPGGSVAGVAEAWRAIRTLRDGKPVVAVANHTAASAGYWLASAADRVLVTESGEIGAIGVFTIHEDRSAELEAKGIRPTVISAGKFKAEGHPFGPLTPEARAAVQARVDDMYGLFVAAVAEGRRTTQTAVREGYGQGRTLGARAGVKAGLADAIGSLEDAIALAEARAAKRAAVTVAALAADVELEAEAADVAPVAGPDEDDDGAGPVAAVPAPAAEDVAAAAAALDDADMRRRRARLAGL